MWKGAAAWFNTGAWWKPCCVRSGVGHRTSPLVTASSLWSQPPHWHWAGTLIDHYDEKAASNTQACQQCSAHISKMIEVAVDYFTRKTTCSIKPKGSNTKRSINFLSNTFGYTLYNFVRIPQSDVHGRFAWFQHYSNGFHWTFKPMKQVYFPIWWGSIFYLKTVVFKWLFTLYVLNFSEVT